MGSHAFEEHTGEVAVRLAAASWRELLEEAGSALAELLAEDVPAPDGPDEPVRVEASDREALLVAWIDELVYRTERRGRVYSRFELRRATDRELEGSIAGAVPRSFRTAVKAATFHGLRVEEGPEGLTSRVVLDV